MYVSLSDRFKILVACFVEIVKGVTKNKYV